MFQVMVAQRVTLLRTDYLGTHLHSSTASQHHGMSELKRTAVYNLVGEDSEVMEVKVLGSGLLGNAHSPSTEEESDMAWDCSGERLQQAPAKH